MARRFKNLLFPDRERRGQTIEPCYSQGLISGIFNRSKSLLFRVTILYMQDLNPNAPIHENGIYQYQRNHSLNNRHRTNRNTWIMTRTFRQFKR